MPQWIDTPAGPQYVDEYGNPAVPPQPQPPPDALVTDFENADRLAGGQPAPMPTRQMAVDPSAAIAPIAQPAPTAAPVPGATPGVNRGESISQSQSAFSLPSFQAVDSTIPGLRSQQNTAFQNAEAGRRSESQFTAAIGGDQARAATDLGDAEAEMQRARGDMFSQQAQLQSQMASAEVAAANIAAQQTSGYRARFEQQLSAASAMRVDPRLTFSTGDGVGAAALLFTQGFLGSQGVPVFDAQGMINRLVDRKVDGDLLAIQQGHRLAEGTKQLWDMARFEAADEADARSRYRALTMAQAATEMEATTAQFGSRVAAAKGQAAAADIRVQINKDLASITDRYFTRYMQESKLALDEWQTKVQASNASGHLALAKREMALKEAAAGKAKPVNTENVVFDVTESGERKAKWKFLDGLSDGKRGELLDRLAGKATFLANIRELRSMEAEAGTRFGGWGQAITNDAFAKRVKNISEGMAASYVRAMSGAAATDRERTDLKARFPVNYLLQREGEQFVREGLSDFQHEVVRETNNTIGQFATDIDPNSPEGQLIGGSPDWAKAEGVEADIVRRGRGETKTPVRQSQEQLTDSSLRETTIRPTALWTQVGNPVETRFVDDPASQGDNVKEEQRIPGWAPAMENIFKIAVTPKAGWTRGDATQPTTDAIEAYRVLNDLKVNAKDAAQRDYATDLLELIDDSAPQGVRPFSISDLIE